MFYQEDLNEDYLREFSNLGINDEDKMLEICKGLDTICEIGYTIFNNIKYNNKNYDKKTEVKSHERGEDNCKAA